MAEHGASAMPPCTAVLSLTVHSCYWEALEKEHAFLCGSAFTHCHAPRGLRALPPFAAI